MLRAPRAANLFGAMQTRFAAVTLFALLCVAACGGKKEEPLLPSSARAITYEAPRRDGTTLIVVQADGSVDVGSRPIAPDSLSALESHLTPIATSHNATMPPKGTPAELAISDSVLRIRAVADAPLSAVTAVVEQVLQTLCVTWPGAARIYFDVATPSIKIARIYPTMVRAIAGLPGKSADKSYVALRVMSVAALPANHDAAKPWTLTITPNAGGTPEVAASIAWDDLVQRVAATKTPSELVIDIDVLGTTSWNDTMKVLDQAGGVLLNEISLRAAK